jgi:hypothetical protein
MCKSTICGVCGTTEICLPASTMWGTPALCEPCAEEWACAGDPAQDAADMADNESERDYDAQSLDRD